MMQASPQPVDLEQRTSLVAPAPALWIRQFWLGLLVASLIVCVSALWLVRAEPKHASPPLPRPNPFPASLDTLPTFKPDPAPAR